MYSFIKLHEMELSQSSIYPLVYGYKLGVAQNSPFIGGFNGLFKLALIWAPDFLVAEPIENQLGPSPFCL